MAFSKLLDVNTQLTFYGAYHSNSTNVMIHMICVPILLWSGQVMGASLLPVPSIIPNIHYSINEYLVFDLNAPAIHAGLYLVYYLFLEPFAALLYVPQLALSVLTATAFSQGHGHVTQAVIIHAICWVAQFLGHGLAEGRAPALLDNLIGAVVLAPFFVHLEILFMLGYRPDMHKRINNEIGKEITRIRKAEGSKARVNAKKQ
ncbi:hypothetical protein BD779DRAFT_1667241 [Infundibulicybe gibba]|nr:hypothetical protein BD779DRAFT_1667241 [Infundibulicybe gibba]